MAAACGRLSINHLSDVARSIRIVAVTCAEPRGFPVRRLRCSKEMTLAIGQSCKPGRQIHRRERTCPPARWCFLMVRQKETLGSRALVVKVIGYLHSRQHERDHGTCNHNRSPFRMIIDIFRLGVGVSLVESLGGFLIKRCLTKSLTLSGYEA